jgi:hypothetical protein
LTKSVINDVFDTVLRECRSMWGLISFKFFFIHFFLRIFLTVKVFLNHSGFLDHVQLTHTVGLLWTSDQPVAEASTYTGHHNIETQETNIHALSGIRTRDPSNEAAADLRLRRRGYRRRLIIFHLFIYLFCDSHVSLHVFLSKTHLRLTFALSWTVPHSERCCQILTSTKRIFCYQATSSDHTEWHRICKKMFTGRANACRWLYGFRGMLIENLRHRLSSVGW